MQTLPLLRQRRRRGVPTGTLPHDADSVPLERNRRHYHGGPW